MTPDHAAKLLPIMQAFSEGKTVQCETWGAWTDWRYGDSVQPKGTSDIFVPQLCDARIDWRVKPEPREYWMVGGIAGFTFLSLKDAQIERAKGRYEEIIHVREVL